ncbi:ArsR/SmtB family transcription factor [Catellatospora sichuanensis]|uniref:ArsR/SmtB family transcription factor n=1 Tax=Catellatospora sichuanensis TaxID=1969805 RepID=UPI001C9248D1|nr:helix-turn-helix domain-containing protein [Catellatospora sichuanensis]
MTPRDEKQADRTAQPADEPVMRVTSPEHYKALAHPMRHRLLFALERPATVSRLAAVLRTNKGNVAHHLKVLVEAGLVRPAGTRTVRGGTEQYYARPARALHYTGPGAAENTAVAFQALGAEIAAAAPDPLLVLRHLRLTAEQVRELTVTLTALAEDTPDAGDDGMRYGLLLGLYRPHEPDGSSD